MLPGPGAGSTVKQLEENILHTYWLDSIFITFGNVYIRHVYSSAQGGYEMMMTDYSLRKYKSGSLFPFHMRT